MNKTEITNVILSYFSGFAERNVETVSKNFADHVILQDWEGKWESKESVKEAIQSVFLNTKSLVIIPKDIQVSVHGHRAIATCRIDIIINNNITMKVVDVITLHNDFTGWLITNIDAYKQ